MIASDSQGAPLAPIQLVDSHCHLGFMSDPVSVAKQAAAAGVGIASMTVTPEAYVDESVQMAAFPHVVVGAGLHPWWAAGARSDGRLDLLLDAIPRTALVGEVGLDFAPRHADTADDQVAAFREVARVCARVGGKVLSLHAVRSAGAVLDILEESSCLDACTCVFHWFSGASDELSRAIKAGCLFSVGMRMLETRRGRAYVRAIPTDRLLLETDAPPTGEALPRSGGAPYMFDRLLQSLEDALAAIEKERGELLKDRIAETSRSVFAW